MGLASLGPAESLVGNRCGQTKRAREGKLPLSVNRRWTGAVYFAADLVQRVVFLRNAYGIGGSEHEM
jgi:hypothetical protein